MILMDGAWVPDVPLDFFFLFIFNTVFEVQSLQQVKLIVMRLAEA